MIPRTGWIYRTCDARFIGLFSLVILLIFAVTPVRGDDWPQYRGINRDGISAETGWLQIWPPIEMWRQTVGLGFSSPSISEGRVYTMGMLGGTGNPSTETVYCFDAYTGSNIWSYTYSDGGGMGACVTPTVDTNNVYTFGNVGNLYCFNKVTGSVVWSDYFSPASYGREGEWGWTGSPLVDGNMLIVNAGGGVAVDKNTGTIIWSNPGGGSFDSPKALTYNSQRIILMNYGGNGGNGICGMYEATGAAVSGWQYSCGYGEDAEFYGTNEFFCGGGLYQMGSGGLTTLWKQGISGPPYSACVIVGDYVYSYGNNGGNLTCVSLANGALMWAYNGGYSDYEGCVVASDGKVICLNAGGTLAILKADPTGYNTEGRTPYQITFEPYQGQGNSSPRATPSLANGLLYCRDCGSYNSVHLNQQANLICFNLGSGGKSAPTVTDASGATAIAANSATLNGQLVSTGNLATAVSVYWGTADGGTNATGWNHVMNFGAQAVGLISTNVTGLAPGTTYYYTYSASNSDGMVWAIPSAQFATMSAPAINNGSGATGVLPGSATLNGNLTAGGSASVSVYWGATDGGTSTSSWPHVSGLGTVNQGAFSCGITGLSPVSNYCYRCYATNAAGMAWAVSPATFQTPASQLTAWSNKMMIAFSGYNHGETLTNFPALVVLSTNISGLSYSQFASTNGYDLCFSASDGSTNLNYEIEKWATNGNSYVWVQVPQLSNSCSIWAYWGNPNVASSPAAYTTNGATWDSKFLGVWHLSALNGSGEVPDSTASNRAGTSGSTAVPTNGVVDGGWKLDGSANGCINYGSVGMGGAISRTLSGWAKSTTGSNSHYANLFGAVWGGSSYDSFEFDCDASSPPNYVLGFYPSSEYSVICQPGTNVWKYLSGTYDNTTKNCYAYLNGAYVTSVNLSGNTPATHDNFIVGWADGGGADAGLNGSVDEVRVESVARSSNWIWACYMTMASNASFSAYGSVQSGPVTTNFTINAGAGPNGSIVPAGSVIVASGNSQTFTITPNTACSITNVVVDGSSVGATNSYSFNNVMANHAINAYFSASSVTNFTINADTGPNGSIVPSGVMIVSLGSNQTFSITPNTGYGITNVVVDGSSVGVTNSYSFNNVTAGHTIIAFFGATGGGMDWPCYRGPNKDGSTTETIASWPPKEIWRASIGQGFSQVVVSQGHVYTMGWLNGLASVYCYSASSTGTNPSVLWQASYPAAAGIDGSGYYGTCPTPAVDGNSVYTFSTVSGGGLLNCFDAATGHTNWSVNVGTASQPIYGFCGSPLVEGSNVIVDAGGNGVAYNKYSGSLQWASSGTAGYGSPYAVTVGTQRTVVVNSSAACFGVDPVSGTVLWNYSIQSMPDDPGSIDPIIYNNQLWVAQSWGVASLLNLGSGSLTNVVWQTNSTCGDNCSVFYNGYIYGSSYPGWDQNTFQYDLGGGFQCVEFTTGITKWYTNGAEFGEYTSAIRAGTQLVILAGGSSYGSNGNLVVANVAPTGYQEVYRANGILPGYTWTCPTLSNGRLYIRNNTAAVNAPATLICYDVSASGGTNYTITASAGSNGSIAPSGAVSVPSGSNQTFTITGNSGYIVTNVFVDGSPVGVPNSYAFYNVTAGHTISAFFGAVGGPVGFNAWTNRMMVSFSGYNRSETLTNFPALVVLSTNISGFSYRQFASTNGYDLCFSPSDGSTNLNYEIEKWNTNGNSCVWVQVPQSVQRRLYLGLLGQYERRRCFRTGDLYHQRRDVADKCFCRRLAHGTVEYTRLDSQQEQRNGVGEHNQRSRSDWRRPGRCGRVRDGC